VTFAVMWAVYGQPQARHESMMPLLSFSPINVYNPPTLYSVRNILRKQSASYFILTDKHLIKYWYLFSMVNPTVATIFY